MSFLMVMLLITMCFVECGESKNNEENSEDRKSEYAENYDKVKGLGLFDAPIDVQEYDSMKSGPTVRFDYDAGVSIIWTKDTDKVIVTYDEE